LLGLGQLYLFGFVHEVFGTPSVVFGLEKPHEWLEHRLAYFPCAESAGLEKDPNARVLLVGEQRSYYLPVDSVPTQVYQQKMYQELAKAAADGPDFARRLREKGFTHVLWVPGEASRLGTYGVLDGLERPSWSGLLGASKQVTRSTGCALYALP